MLLYVYVTPWLPEHAMCALILGQHSIHLISQKLRKVDWKVF